MKQNTTYKQTELGLIPDDWEVKKLGEILKEYSLGGNYENNSEESGIPLIKMGNIGRGKIDLSKIEYLPKNVNYSKNDILKYNDILFNTRNTLDLVGKVSIWKNEALFALYNSNLLRLYFKEDFVENNDYVNFQFNSEITLANLKKYATGTTSVAAIYTKDLLKLKFLLPPLPEQKKIADCLSTWDSAIEKQSALINALTQRKKALMQQLLTGKKRLPGFSDEWKEVKLGEISIKKSSTLQANSLEENNGEFKVYGASGIVANIDFYNESEEYIGIVKDGSGVGNLMLCDAKSSVLGTLDIIKNNKKSNLFFIYLILSKIHFEKYKVGGAIPHIYYRDYSREKINIPSLSEQTAIAEILTIADRELQLQKEKLAQLQTQKKGLMQVLLTGKKRLIN
jgi:type I restriction enzyme S subunit